MRAVETVSIADATLASSQPRQELPDIPIMQSFNRRRDACFLATWGRQRAYPDYKRFNRRRDACFLATPHR